MAAMARRRAALGGLRSVYFPDTACSDSISASEPQSKQVYTSCRAYAAVTLTSEDQNGPSFPFEIAESLRVRGPAWIGVRTYG